MNIYIFLSLLLCIAHTSYSMHQDHFSPEQQPCYSFSDHNEKDFDTKNNTFPFNAHYNEDN